MRPSTDTRPSRQPLANMGHSINRIAHRSMRLVRGTLGGNMKDFFNQPFKFSFKDFLAIVMIVPFLICVFRFMFTHIEGDLDLLKVLVPVVMAVLGGYFGQEMVSSYFTRGQNNAYGYNYTYSTVTPVSTTATTDTSANEPYV